MDNLISETNAQLKVIANNLETIKEEYEKKLEVNTHEMSIELEAVKKYKDEFFSSKKKVEKMNDDIEGFESDYQNLVDRFKDDELANILIAANKEISAKIEERKRKIIRDKKAMNELVAQAEIAKEKLVKLNAEKAALDLCLSKIDDAYEFYSTAISKIVSYSEENEGNLSDVFHEKTIDEKEEEITNIEKEINNITVDEDILETEVQSILEEDNEEDEDIDVDIKEIVLDEDTEKIEEDSEEIEEDDDDEKTIIMDAIIDTDEFNITDDEIEESLNDIDEVIDINDELEEDDSLYKEKETNNKNNKKEKKDEK